MPWDPLMRWEWEGGAILPDDPSEAPERLEAEGEQGGEERPGEAAASPTAGSIRA